MRHKIIRTNTRAEGGITKDEKRSLEKVSNFWIKNAFRTDTVNVPILTKCIENLYSASGLPKPCVVVVPSPLVMAFAYGASSVLLDKADAATNAATNAATDAATRAATRAATYNATYLATAAATDDATRAATYAATGAATDAATYAATAAATRAATRAATYAATIDATDAATYLATAAATDDATRAATYAATGAATDAATYAATAAATRAATRAATYAATIDATDAATYLATAAATDDATRAATYAATGAATDAATYAATAAATRAATRAATYAATIDATDAATYAATYAATRAATNDATYLATAAATAAATNDATYAATDAAIYAATNAATDDATYAEVNIEKAAVETCLLLAGEEGIRRAWNWGSVYQGGNMWSSLCSYISGARDVLGLDLAEHKNYKIWEDCALNGGFRVMHRDFCIVSDFPEILKVDENNQPHCENGPSHRWRDGWSLYHWHGVRVPSQWIEDKENLDPIEVLKEEDVEKRAAGISIIGMGKVLDHLKHVVIDSHEDPECGDLIEVWLPDLPDSELYLKFHCPRNGDMMEPVNKREMNVRDLRHAHAWHSRVPVHLYKQPEQRS